MTLTRTTLQALTAAGLLAAAALTNAQTAMPNPGPGEASTVSPAGEPNPTQRPGGAGVPADRSTVRSDAAANNRSPSNNVVPGAGEASTKIGGQPNATPSVSQRTRAEVRKNNMQHKKKHAHASKGERTNVPTNPVSETGTPK